MLESLTTSYLWNMAYFLTTLTVLRMILIYLNWSMKPKVQFGKVLDELIHQNPLGAALYYSARWIGLCILASAFLR